MKKPSTSVSPFLLLIIPVILFACLSLLLKTDEQKEEFAETGHTEIKTVEKVNVSALINIVASKF